MEMKDMQNNTAQRMQLAAEDIWKKCIDHPFVRAIGDGTLPVERFRYFMVQDYLYLYEYARVFALGIARAQDPQLMRMFAQSVNQILDGEMKIHRAYMQRLGISEKDIECAAPALENTSYTAYMISVASRGSAMEIVAALLACSWSYAEIGKELNAIPHAAEHPFYGEWIRGYASEEYALENQTLIDWMNRLAADAGEAQLAELETIFANCCRYELGFWNMAWEAQG